MPVHNNTQRMNSYISGLSPADLSTLLEGTGNVGAAIGRLEKLAATGDANSIELLLNLSMSADDAVSDRAQHALFELRFDRHAPPDIGNRIARDTLRFYEDHRYTKFRFASAATQESEVARKFAASQKLLLLAEAGARLENAPARLEEIQRMLEPAAPERSSHGVSDNAPAPPGCSSTTSDHAHGNSAPRRSGILRRAADDKPFDCYSDRLPHLADHAASSSTTSSRSIGAIDTLDARFAAALKNDSSGRQAENALFELFSSSSTIADVIAKKALQVYKDTDGNNKNRLPVKLLYMAGAATRFGNDDYEQIVDLLNTKHFILESMIDEAHSLLGLDPERHALWGTTRFATGTEVMFAIKSMHKDDSPIAIPQRACEPWALGNHPSGGWLDNAFGEDRKPLFVPFWHQRHFMSLIAYTDSDAIRKAVVFTSLRGYYLGESILEEALSKAGVDPQHIVYLEGGLQNWAKNACGMYTVEAYKRLATASAGTPPVAVINQMISDFEGHQDAQKQFNISSRRRMFGAVVDYLRDPKFGDEVSFGRLER